MPRRVPFVPTVRSKTQEKEWNDYSKGVNRFLGNDLMPEGGDPFWRIAQNARMPSQGEYETRQGIDYLGDAVGVTQDQAQTSTTGASSETFSVTRRVAQVFTAGSSRRLSKVTVRLKNDTGGIGTPIIALYSNNSGEPGDLIAKTSIQSSLLTDSYQYLTARFHDAPLLTSSSNYWLVLYVQTTGSNTYSVSTTTTATTALLSTDSGVTWDSTAYSINFTTHNATSGAIKGLHRAEKSDGTTKTLIAHGTSLYSVDDSGTVTQIKSGLSSSATHYRFKTVNDTVYYVNRYDGIRKWDFTTESQVSTTNATDIEEHAGLLFFIDATDRNRVFFSNFGDYETFTSTDFIYVPAPKTGDPCVALNSLSGSLIIQTFKTKYILYGSDNATFQLQQAPATGRKGTFTKENTSSDGNFLYFLSDDGLYRFNGTSDELISKAAYEDVKKITNKDRAVVVYNRGRVYLWYSAPSLSYNSLAYVWSINFDMLESLDTDTHVARAVTAKQNDSQLIVGSSLIGQVYWQELASNDYSQLGGAINFLLQTHYMTFGTPSREKEIRYWKPRFGTQSADYDVSCEYATDLRETFQLYENAEVEGTGFVWGDSGTVWGSFTWGTDKERQPDLQVPGQNRRIAVRYKHYAMRQPHRFLGHTFRAEMRDLR